MGLCLPCLGGAAEDVVETPDPVSAAPPRLSPATPCWAAPGPAAHQQARADSPLPPPAGAASLQPPCRGRVCWWHVPLCDIAPAGSDLPWWRFPIRAGFAMDYILIVKNEIFEIQNNIDELNYQDIFSLRLDCSVLILSNLISLKASSRGVKNPYYVEQKKKKQEEMEKQIASSSSGGGGLRWQVG
ncbi:uncharacterized protein LOC112545897 [Pelodiscus sinensis]|uniref:uncharacterized protein LOC112545897 n=1 Tax=Pelodiscus sinensis TaxID=13735 RepID=UPI003F6A7A63